jgi:AcrR family transcriptional regulator
VPIVVDHAAARERIAELAADIVATEGVTALTMRRVAQAAGASRSIVSTYFTDMRDLLLATFERAGDRQAARFEVAVARGARLEECLETLLPLDARRLRDWRVIIAYLGMSVADPELAAIERRRIDGARRRVDALVVRDRGLPRGTAQTRREARTLVALVLGIAVDVAFEPGSVPSPAARRRLRDALREHGAG